VKTNMEIKKGTLMLADDVAEVSVPKDGCFLCQAPDAHSREDCTEAWAVGLVIGLVVMTGEQRPALCAAHETWLREFLVVRIQDENVYERLGIKTRRA